MAPSGMLRSIPSFEPSLTRNPTSVAIEATSKTDEELWKDSGKAFASIVGTEDFKEGPKAFIEKRAPVWKGK